MTVARAISVVAVPGSAVGETRGFWLPGSDSASMNYRSDIAPSTLPVAIDAEGVDVEYLDGRTARYREPREETAGPVRCRPGTEVHVLVADPAEAEGVMVYVNDRSTHDDILESTGVGRLILDPGEEASVFPGVTASLDGHSVVVSADPAAAGGRVFVFDEDERGERAYEIVPEES